MKNYLISEEVRVALINYLAKRPYDEVYQGILALNSLQPAPELTEQKEAIPAHLADAIANQKQ